MPTPQDPKIYHITHGSNLASILKAGGLRSDARMIELGGPETTIGMSAIKLRRLTLPVVCHPGDHVGDYVPFYFCSRSVMLYLLHRGNHPEIIYRGGQEPILHLEADLKAAVAWAAERKRRWAFTLSNAGAGYCEFRTDIADLGEVRWEAVEARQWSAQQEGKQAEFLMHRGFPWSLVSRIGVYSMPVKIRVDEIMRDAKHKPRVELQPSWYY